MQRKSDIEKEKKGKEELQSQYIKHMGPFIRLTEAHQKYQPNKPNLTTYLDKFSVEALSHLNAGMVDQD